jgi:hypothetical protein
VTGVNWILRRAQQAHRLDIGPLQSSHGDSIAEIAVHQANNSWEQLRELEIELCHTWNCPIGDSVSLKCTVRWLLRAPDT